MTVLGIRDVSHYDYDRGDVDVSTTPMLIAKFTQGIGFEDPRHQYWLGRGKPTAGYHALEPASHGSISGQVSYALSKIGKSRPVMADIEVWQDAGGANSRFPSFHDALSFCQQVKAAGGNMRAVYIPHWFWSGNWGSPSLTPFADLGLFLISSNFTTYSDTGAGWQPYGGVAPKMWQYSDTPHDKNAFKGTVAQLLALWGFERSQDMALTQSDADLVAQTFLDKVLGRSGPTVGTAIQETYNNVSTLLANPGFTDTQIDTLASKIAAQIVLAHDALSAQDLAGVTESVKTALREGSGSA